MLAKYLIGLYLFSFFTFKYCYSQSICGDDIISKVKILKAKNEPDSTLRYLEDIELYSFENQDFGCWLFSTQNQLDVYGEFLHNREKAVNKTDEFIEKSKNFENINSFSHIFCWFYYIKFKNLQILGFQNYAAQALLDGKTYVEELKEYFSDSINVAAIDRFLYVTAYPNLGQHYEKLGAYEEALIYVDEAINYALQHKVSEKYIAGYYLLKGAIKLEQQNYEEAIAINNKGSELSNIPATISGSLRLNSGLAYLEINDYDKALESVNKALNVYQKIPTTTLRQQGEAYIQLGLINQELGKFTLADQYFRRAIQLGEQNYRRPENPLSAKAFRMLGDLYAEEQRYTQALGYYQEALQRAIPDFHPTDNYTSPPDSLLFNDMELLYALGGKAEVLRQIEDSETPDTSFQILALEHYELLDELEERLRLSYNYETSKLRAEARSRTYYEHAIGTARHLYELTEDPAYLHRAFEFAEKSKAWVLWESINQSQARTEADIPEELRNIERNLQLEIANYERNIETERAKDSPNQPQIVEWESTLNERKLERRRLLERLEADYPRYYQLKYDVQVATIEDVQQGLKEKEAWIEYFYGDEYLYTFFITQGEMDLLQTKIDTTLEYHLSALEGILVSTDFGNNISESWKTFDAHAYQVYQNIMAPLRNKLPAETALYIVPDGPISHIPLEVLIDQSQPNEESRRNFMVYDYPMSYDFSATIHFQNKHDKPDKPLKCLGVAPDFTYASTYPLSQIPNEEGLELIDDMVEGEYLYGKDATEERFKEIAGEYGILHFATHGQMDTAHLYSWLAFTELSKKEDDYLYAYELYAMILKAQLAVLGACETGLGRYQKGEGLMSLARAFAYAGCPALVTSLWQAPDRVTINDILPEFYRGLKQGLTKSESLRQAKLTYLKNTSGIDTYPFYWAAFVSTGDQSSLELANPKVLLGKTPWLIQGIIAILVVGLMVYMFMYRRRRQGEI